MPVRGTYQQGQYSVTTPKAKDSIWDDLTDLIAKNGFSVDVLDKASGIAILSPTQMSVTRERGPYDRGRNRRSMEEAPELANKEAWTVSSYFVSSGTFNYPNRTPARWNVRVRDNGENRTVSVLMYDLKDEPEKPTNPRSLQTPTRPRAMLFSTGRFERVIVETVTR